MFNAHLIPSTNVAIKNAGIQPVELPAIKPLPEAPVVTSRDIAVAILTSTREDPYSDPAVNELVAKMNLTNLGQGLATAYRQEQQERQVAYFEAQTDTILTQLHTEFDATVAKLATDAEAIKGVENFDLLMDSASTPAAMTAAGYAKVHIDHLNKIVIAWEHIWKGLGQFRILERAEDLKYMEATYDQWAILRLRDKARETQEARIWEAFHRGAKLTLAVTPNQVRERFEAANRDPREDAYQAKRDHIDKEAARFYAGGTLRGDAK